ncbi:MAG: M6 family metalloprotease domain-containing protein [Polyangiales bacterium]
MQRILITLLCLVGVSTARADIVWEGETVPAWPEGAWDAPSPYAAKKFYPSPQGVVKGLTILVDFSDQAPAFDTKAIDAWLNERNYTGGGLKGSVRDYYFDVSNGKVDFQNEVVGFYRAKKTKAYYEGGNAYARSDELFAEVIAGIDGEVDFSKFDNDGDGRTDSISLVYAGEAVKWGQGLWPHASGSAIRADGVLLSRYMMSALSRKLALYTFVHEVGHMLFGWPDLYGFGDYCVMGNATNPVDPAGVNDFFRADQGWIPEIPITRDMNTSAVAPASGAGFRYTNPLDDGECFFWSNVQKDQGRWRVLRGSGLLFFHYKRSVRVNNPPNPLALRVVQADGRDDLGATQWPSPGSDAKDFFFGGGVDELADGTKPSTRWRDGTSSGLRVYDIAPNGREMRFSVGTGTPDDSVLRHDAGVAVEDASVPDAAVDAGHDAGSPEPLDASQAAPVRDASVDARVDDARVVDARADTEDDAPRERDEEGCALGGSSFVGAPWLALLVMKLRRRRSKH